ncbi:MAG TPA: DnaJ domain-containing protein [Polyangiaceae bacterium]
MVPCDVGRLPIGPLEAFVLSQVHGTSSVEQIAETAGLDVDDLVPIARKLVEVGALAIDDDRGKTRRPRPRGATERPSPRVSVRPPVVRSLVPPAVVPVSKGRRDLRSLNLGPREAFVLSQIDGATSAEDLAEITQLTARELSDALHALDRAGAIDLGRPGRPTSKPPAPRATRQPPPAKATTRPPAKATKTVAPPPKGTTRPPKRATVAPQRPSKAPAPVASRPSKAPPASSPPKVSNAPSSGRELPEADRLRIAEMAGRIERLDHYAALGIQRDADAKAIRRAYHALAAQFHPDRFFGKNLGPSRQVLDRIFARLTLASDVLSKKSRREEYDATLPPLPPPRAPTQKPPRRQTRKSMRAARASASVLAAAPKPAPAPPPTPAPVPVPVPAAAPAPAPSSSPDHLRRMYAAKQRSATQEHVDVFIRAAREALDRKDVVAAANHYRLAAQNSEDPAILAALEDTQARARVHVRETSIAAARAAEQAARWSEAGAKYAKAFGTCNEPWMAERAAYAFHREGSDLRRAAQLGEQAVLAEPQNMLYRLTLAEIYLDAGLAARAAGEAARALALAPADVRAIALSKKIAKGKNA